MAILDITPLFTNIPLEETINICLNESFYKKQCVLRRKESVFIFNKTFYKQLDSVAMGSPLGLALSNSFLCYHKKRWLDKCPEEFKSVFYR